MPWCEEGMKAGRVEWPTAVVEKSTLLPNMFAPRCRFAWHSLPLQGFLRSLRGVVIAQDEKGGNTEHAINRKYTKNRVV